MWFPELCQQLEYFSRELRKSLVSRYREGWREQEKKKGIKGHLEPLKALMVKPDKRITILNGSTGIMGIKGDKGDEGSRGSSRSPGIRGVKGEQGYKGEKGKIVNSAETVFFCCFFFPPNQYFFSFQISIFALEFPFLGFQGRMEGMPRILGMPRIPGAPGPQGQQGKDGAKREPGVKRPWRPWRVVPLEWWD